MKKYRTETEIQQAKEQDLLIIEKQITDQKLTLDELNHFIPGYLHLNDISTLALDYVTNTLEENLGIPKQMVFEDGFGIVVKVVHPADLQPCIKRCKALYEQQNPYTF